MGNHVFNTPSPNKKFVAEVGALVTSGLEKPKKEEGTAEYLLRETFAQAARGKLERLAGPAGPLIGWVIDWGAEKIGEHRENENYIAGIKALAEEGTPGFLFEEKEVDGKRVQIAIDASRKVSNPEAKPFIWANTDDVNDPKIKELIATAEEKANSEIEGFRQESLADLPARKGKYLEELNEYALSIQKEESSVSPSPPPSPQFSVADDYRFTLNEARDSISNDVSARRAEVNNLEKSRIAPPPDLAIGGG